MNSRKDFLTGLFRSLESNVIPYCVLRNYDDLYADALTSDIDLIVEKRDLKRFQECLHAAAERAQHRFVHQARYVNHSHVFWNSAGEFVRIDFETEVRWRVFPVLSARDVLACRRKRDEFFIPDPRHESVILLVQAVWRGSLSDRYRQQLARLYDACANKEELRRTYREAFGAAGDELAALHSQISNRDFDAELCARVKSSLVRKAFSSASGFCGLFSNAWDDGFRLWDRLRRPAGISLLFASSSRKDKNFQHLVQKIEFLFPAQKCFIQTIDLTKSRFLPPGWELGLKVQRLRTLFKGGLFVRYYRLDGDADLNRVTGTFPRLLYPSRAFVCLEDSKQKACLAHVGTGFMADFPINETRVTDSDFSNLLIEFISTVLAKQKHRRRAPARQRGLFAVLIGLDGSGKTTLARNLAHLASLGSQFDGVRYFHWRPRIFGRMELPLPDFHDQPRKEPLPKTPINSLLSSLRLLKNVLLANLAYWLRVRQLLRHNHLVMVDRYYYNYFLDPDSVKYVGPPWLLQRMQAWFPKPDVVITLDAGAETLLARKRELSPEQIARQIAIKDKLNYKGRPCIALDARQPALRVAETAFAAVAKTISLCL